MAQVTISQDIRPISDLKAKGSEIVSQAAATGRPVVLTRHGRGVAVVLAVDDYERLQRSAETKALTEALDQGRRDVEAGRTLSQEQMRNRWLDGYAPGDPEEGYDHLARLQSALKLNDQQTGQILGVSATTVRRWKKKTSAIPTEVHAVLSEANDSVDRLRALFLPEKLPLVIRREAGLFDGDTALEWILQGRIRDVADRYDLLLQYQA